MPIRFRLALAFSGVAALLAALGAWLFVSLLSSTLLGSIDSQLTTAVGVANRYVIPTIGNHVAAAPLPGEYVLQVLDASGAVRAASADSARSPLIPRSQLRRASVSRVTLTQSTEGETVRVVAEPYRAKPGWVAVAAVSLESYDHSVRDIETGAIVGGTLVVVIAAIGSYLLARRALAPVERLRREVAALSEREDDAAIAVPGTRDELATLARTMNDILRRIHAALARQRAFVADASHELRTPLAVLSGELELAGRPDRTKEDLVAAVASASEEVARLNRLTEDLLLLARADSDRLLLRLDRVDITDLLERSASVAARRAEHAGVHVDVVGRTGLEAEVDADRIRQAVDNLLDNALRFAPEGSDVELRATALTGILTIEVLDRGPGFPADFLPVAFERFRRPSGERGRDDGGAGLGLAIVQTIAKTHGGTTSAFNRVGGGAGVRIDLPIESRIAKDVIAAGR